MCNQNNCFSPTTMLNCTRCQPSQWENRNSSIKLGRPLGVQNLCLCIILLMFICAQMMEYEEQPMVIASEKKDYTGLHVVMNTWKRYSREKNVKTTCTMDHWWDDDEFVWEGRISQVNVPLIPAKKRCSITQWPVAWALCCSELSSYL